MSDADHTTFLKRVEQALTVHLQLHPAPVVIVGPDRVLARFRALTKMPRIAGTIPANIGNHPLTALTRRIRPVMETYLRGRQDEALRLLDRCAVAAAGFGHDTFPPATGVDRSEGADRDPGSAGHHSPRAKWRWSSSCSIRASQASTSLIRKRSSRPTRKPRWPRPWLRRS